MGKREGEGGGGGGGTFIPAEEGDMAWRAASASWCHCQERRRCSRRARRGMRSRSRLPSSTRACRRPSCRLAWGCRNAAAARSHHAEAFTTYTGVQKLAHTTLRPSAHTQLFGRTHHPLHCEVITLRFPDQKGMACLYIRSVQALSSFGSFWCSFTNHGAAPWLRQQGILSWMLTKSRVFASILQGPK